LDAGRFVRSDLAVPELSSPADFPAFQTTSCIAPGVSQVIAASVGNLAVAAMQDSPTHIVFAAAQPLTVMLNSAGLPKLASAVITISMGTWVSLLAALLGQLSPLSLFLVILNVIISFFGRSGPVLATNVQPGLDCNTDRVLSHGPAPNCGTVGSPSLNTCTCVRQGGQQRSANTASVAQAPHAVRKQHVELPSRKARQILQTQWQRVTM
jgi:hypothetical protein